MVLSIVALCGMRFLSVACHACLAALQQAFHTTRGHQQTSAQTQQKPATTVAATALAGCLALGALQSQDVLVAGSRGDHRSRLRGELLERLLDDSALELVAIMAQHTTRVGSRHRGHCAPCLGH